jgi:hypothetical protein
MPALASDLLNAQPREKAGARTGARFAFQIHATLAKLLDLHEAGIDDLTILVGSSEPTGLIFYQIKGREPGPWKTTHLCSASGAAPRTTVGKMYHHTTTFGGQVEAAIFLTNAPFEFALADGGKSTPDHMVLVLPDLAASVTAAFAKALQLDFPAPRAPPEVDVIRFERTRVPLVGYDTFVKGRLLEMFSDLPGSTIAPLYRTLVADITAKSHDTTVCTTIEDLYARKGLGRGDLENVLSQAEAHRNILSHWESVEAELIAMGRPLPARLKLRNAVINYLRYRSKRMPEAFMLHRALRQAAKAVVSAVSPTMTLCDVVTLLISQVAPTLKETYDDLLWEAALLVEAFDAVNGQ